MVATREQLDAIRRMAAEGNTLEARAALDALRRETPADPDIAELGFLVEMGIFDDDGPSAPREPMPVVETVPAAAEDLILVQEYPDLDEYAARERREVEALRAAAHATPRDVSAWLALHQRMSRHDPAVREVLRTVAELLAERAPADLVDRLRRSLAAEDELEWLVLLAETLEAAGERSEAVRYATEVIWQRDVARRTNPDALDRAFTIQARLSSTDDRDAFLVRLELAGERRPGESLKIVEERLRGEPGDLRLLEERIVRAMQARRSDAVRDAHARFADAIAKAPASLAEGRLDSGTRVLQLRRLPPDDGTEATHLTRQNAVRAARLAIDKDPLRLDLREAWAEVARRDARPAVAAGYALVAAAVAMTIGLPGIAARVLSAVTWREEPFLGELLERVRADAAEDPRKAGRRAPDTFDVPSHAARAEELSRHGLMGEALEALERVADMLEGRDLPRSYTQVLEAMLAIDPDREGLARRAAVALWNVRNLDAAFEAAQRALRANGDDADALRVIADVFEARGDIERATAARARLR